MSEFASRTSRSSRFQRKARMLIFSSFGGSSSATNRQRSPPSKPSRRNCMARIVLPAPGGPDTMYGRPGTNPPWSILSSPAIPVRIFAAAVIVIGPPPPFHPDRRWWPDDDDGGSEDPYGDRRTRQDAPRRIRPWPAVHRVRPARRGQDDPRHAVPPRGLGGRGTLPVRRTRGAAERAEDQHAGLPLEPGRPRRPRCELGHPALRAHPNLGNLDGGGADQSPSLGRSDPQDPGLREQRGHGPLVATAAEDAVAQEELRAGRDRFDYRAEVLLHARVRGGRHDAVVHAVPRGVEGDLPAHARAPGGGRGPAGGLPRPRGNPTAQAPR